jgi:uncharacterized damage-inducible protein DinB
MMKKYFIDLFEFNNWANDKIINRLQEVNFQFSDQDPFRIFSHIISSQETWLERVKRTKSYNIFLWDVFSIQELEILSMKNHKEWIKFISKLEETKFNTLCKYKNSEGKTQEKILHDILQHVVNHSTYHRGQINQIFKMNKIKPVLVDFINYC